MGLPQMSLHGAVLIAAIAAVRALLQKKLPRRTFLVLWSVALARLLLPFSLPSVYSVYSAPALQTRLAPRLSVTAGTVPAAVPQSAVSPWTVLWAAGTAALALYFLLGYLYFRQRFRFSLPVAEEFPLLWLLEHPIRRTVRLRRCGSIAAPLTYGIFRPVILLPDETDWQDTEQLRYILMHEMTHIRRFDTLWKLLSTAALCLHWFNPLVWLLCVLLGRDIELACDECVVRQLGEPLKSSYAMTLIQLEEQKIGLSPFHAGFSSPPMEERIRSIMRFKKASFAALTAAVVLVVGITVAFATSADAGTKWLPEDAAMLRRFQFPGYEEMTITEFQEQAELLLDEPEMYDWWTEMENALDNMDADDPLSDFYLLLNQLVAEQQVFHVNHAGAIASNTPFDQAILEYVYRIEIPDLNRITVGEYVKASGTDGRDLIYREMEQLFDSLNGKDVAPDLLQQQISSIFEKRSSDALRFTLLEWSYHPMMESENADETQTKGTRGETSNAVLKDDTEAEAGTEIIGESRFPPPTQADIDSLLALKTPDYKSMSLETFNAALLEWANADYDRMERINGADAYLEDAGLSLTLQDRDFITLTVRASGEENAMMVRSHYTGRPEEDPSLTGKSLMRGSEGSGFWCDLYYEFSYHIADKSRTAVGERDRCLNNLLWTIENFWNDTSLEELAKLDEAEMMAQLDHIAERCSSENVVISILKERSGYQVMDEHRIY